MQKITEFKRIRHKKRLRTKETGGKSSKSAIKAAIKRGIEKGILIKKAVKSEKTHPKALIF